MKKFLILAAALLIWCNLSAQKLTETYLFAHRDTCDLYFDVYEPVPGSETAIDGIEKPTVLFVFGGGFIIGSRSEKYFFPWFKMLTENGYRVISIDYRLGLKGVKMDFSPFGLLKSTKYTIAAEYMGVEDLFSAVSYIIDNKEALGVDPANIVLAGSSAGALISMVAEQSICNRDSWASVLPEDFNFKGVISFSGAIVGKDGTPKYGKAPCPTLFLHGMDDDTVPYRKLQFLKYGMWGSDALSSVFKKNGYPHCIYRYKGHKHDIASAFVPLFDTEIEFIEKNLMKGLDRKVDAVVDDPSLPVIDYPSFRKIY